MNETLIKARAMAEEAKAELYSRLTIQFLLGFVMVLSLAYYMYMGIQFLLLSGLEGVELFNAWVSAWDLIIDRIIYLLAGAGFVALTSGGDDE